MGESAAFDRHGGVRVHPARTTVTPRLCTTQSLQPKNATAVGRTRPRREPVSYVVCQAEIVGHVMQRERAHDQIEGFVSDGFAKVAHVGLSAFCASQREHRIRDVDRDDVHGARVSQLRAQPAPQPRSRTRNPIASGRGATDDFGS
jgi:hypothetical protein